MDYKDELQRRFHTDNQVLNREANQVEYEQSGEINSAVGGTLTEMRVVSTKDVTQKLRKDMATSVETWAKDSKDYKDTYTELVKNTEVSKEEKEKLEKFFTGKKGRKKSDRMAKITDMHKAAEQLLKLNQGLVALSEKQHNLTIQEQISVYLIKIDIAEQERIYQYKNIKLFGDTGVIEKEKLAQNDYECRVKQNYLLGQAKLIAESYLGRNKMDKKALKTFMAGIVEREKLYGGKTESKALDTYEKARQASLKEQFKKDYRKGQIVGNHRLQKPVINKIEKPLENGPQIVDQIVSGPEFTEKEVANLKPEQIDRLREYLRIYKANITNEEVLKGTTGSKERRDLVLSKINLYEKIIEHYEGQKGSVFRKSPRNIKEAIKKVNQKKEALETDTVRSFRASVDFRTPIAKADMLKSIESLNACQKDTQALIAKTKEKLAYEQKTYQELGFEVISDTQKELDKLEKRQRQVESQINYLNKYIEFTESLVNNFEESKETFAEFTNATTETITKDFKDLDANTLVNKYSKWVALLNMGLLKDASEKLIFAHPQFCIYYNSFTEKNIGTHESLVMKKDMIVEFLTNIEATKETLKKTDEAGGLENDKLTKEEKGIFNHYKESQAREKLDKAMSGKDEQAKKDAKIDYVRWLSRVDTKSETLSEEQKQENLQTFNTSQQTYMYDIHLTSFYRSIILAEFFSHPECERSKKHFKETIGLLGRDAFARLFKPIKFDDDGNVSEESKAAHQENLDVIKSWLNEDEKALDKTYHDYMNRAIQYQISSGKVEKFSIEEAIRRKNISMFSLNIQNITKDDPLFEAWLEKNGFDKDALDLLRIREIPMTGATLMFNEVLKSAGLNSQGQIGLAGNDRVIPDDESFEDTALTANTMIEGDLSAIETDKNLKDSVKQYRLNLAKEVFTEKSKTRDILDLAKEMQTNISEQYDYLGQEYEKSLTEERKASWDENDQNNQELIALQKQTKKKESRREDFEQNGNKDAVLRTYHLVETKGVSEVVSRVIVEPLLKPVVRYNGDCISKEEKKKAEYNDKLLNDLSKGNREINRNIGQRYLDELLEIPEPSEELIKSGFLTSDEYDLNYADKVLGYSEIIKSENIIPGLCDSIKELEKNDNAAFKKLEKKMDFYSMVAGLRTAHLMKKKWDLNHGYNKQYNDENLIKAADVQYKTIIDALKEQLKTYNQV